LAQCQFKVTGWDIMFICGMILQCAGNLNWFEVGPGIDEPDQQITMPQISMNT